MGSTFADRWALKFGIVMTLSKSLWGKSSKGIEIILWCSSSKGKDVKSLSL
jgi:hypothetical protein